MLTRKPGAVASGFSRLTREARFAELVAIGALTEEDVAYLLAGGVQDTQLASQLIENAVGYFQLPLGVATHFCIDDQDYVIPMAVEETSIIAAASNMAKWIKAQGSLTTRVDGDCIVGQIQFARVRDFIQFAHKIEQHRASLIARANADVASSMVARGGGVVDLQSRAILRPDGDTMAVVQLSMNSCDAMGANLINQVLEYLKAPLESLTGESVSMCILSNLNDQKLTTAQVTLHGVDAELGARLEEASLFAELDPYRAATHNKGIMNGMDPVVIATGNDWRAVEAGVHAFAARTGQYRPISRWRYRDGVLHGELQAPVVVGIVGGVTGLHPTAKLCLRMMRITSANQLSRVIAAVGLVQNLGAMRALCSEGIIQGHMKLHIDNLLLSAGASELECLQLKPQLQHALATHGRVSLSEAHALLTAWRMAASNA